MYYVGCEPVPDIARSDFSFLNITLVGWTALPTFIKTLSMPSQSNQSSLLKTDGSEFFFYYGIVSCE